MRSVKSFFLSTISLLFIFATINLAQDINLGADFVSRYVWRGLEYGNTPSVQPSITYKSGGFATGVWGAYTLANQNEYTNEIDGWVGYTFETGNGNIGFLVTDYYYPNLGISVGDFNDGGGAHTFEFTFLYTGPEILPLALTLGYNFYNDPGNNLYFEIGYPLSIKNTNVDFFLGATSGSKVNPSYYGADNFQLINVGIKASKKVRITNDFSIPIFGSLIINPNVEKAYLVFGLSI